MSVFATPTALKRAPGATFVEVGEDCPFAIAPGVNGRATLCKKAWHREQLTLVGIMDCANAASAMSLLQTLPEYTQWEQSRLAHGVNVLSISSAKARLRDSLNEQKSTPKHQH